MKNWTRNETIIAFNLYCKIPFKNCSKMHPMIIKYANILGRTPSALNMKIGNIGRLDPDLKSQGISGLTHGAAAGWYGVALNVGQHEAEQELRPVAQRGCVRDVPFDGNVRHQSAFHRSAFRVHVRAGDERQPPVADFLVVRNPGDSAHVLPVGRFAHLNQPVAVERLQSVDDHLRRGGRAAPRDYPQAFQVAQPGVGRHLLVQPRH